MFFYERDHVPSLAATKALENASLRIDVKRGGFLFVKWTQSQVVATCMTQLDILTNDVNDIRLDADFIDDMWGNAHEQLPMTNYELRITRYPIWVRNGIGAFGKKLRKGLICAWTNHVGSDLTCWNEYESTLMHARVRYVNIVLVIDAISNENHIDVDLTLMPTLTMLSA
jgi:hypothetical protein